MSEGSAPVIFNFQNGTNTIICGPTTTGKTQFIKKVMQDPETFLAPSSTGADMPKDAANNIYFLCNATTDIAIWNSVFPKAINFSVINDITQIEQILLQGLFPTGSVVILDDLLPHFKRLKSALDHHFAVSTHHKQLWTFMLVQRYFTPETIVWRNNVQNFVLFRQSNKRAIRDMFSNLVGSDSPIGVDLYNVATKTPYRPLVLITYRPANNIVSYAGFDGVFAYGKRGPQGIVVDTAVI